MGDLHSISTNAAKQLNRRALDKLFNSNLVAVGAFKISLWPRPGIGDLWPGEIHEVVSGASKPELEKVFSSLRKGDFINNKIEVTEVENLSQTISNIFRPHLEVCSLGCQYGDDPTKQQRREFYKWRLSLDLGEPLLRYGCDQHYNKLTKECRELKPKVLKKRPYPYHLKKYMFGCREEYGEDKHDPFENGPDDVVVTANQRRLAQNRAKAQRFWKRQCKR